jgi:hypothetical protein
MDNKNKSHVWGLGKVNDNNNNNNNNNKRSALRTKDKMNYSYNGCHAPPHTTSADYSYPHNVSHAEYKRCQRIG